MINKSTVRNRRNQYRSDPERFITDLWSHELWSKQREFLGLIKAGHRRIAIKAAHAVSKSFTCGLLVLWNTVCFSPVLTFSTAPTHRQVNEVLWKEIRSNWSSAKYQLSAKAPLAGSPSWEIASNQKAFGASSDKPERLQGLHEGMGRVVALADEACGIEGDIWPAIYSMVTGENDILIAIGNPDYRNPDFMRCFSDSSFATMTISAMDSPNFTEENVSDRLKKALVSRQWVEDLIRMYGDDSPIVRSKVYAEFPESNADTLIPLAYIERAETREPVRDGVCKAGLDIARYGSDQTVAWGIDGNEASLIFAVGKEDLMTTAGRAMLIMNGGADLALDDSGLGGGVTDRLKEQMKYPAPVNFGSKAKDEARFLNSRAEMYWNLRNWIRDTGRIPRNDQLKRELNDIRYEVRSDGRIKIESKDEIRKRTGKSPDHADALALAVSGHCYTSRSGYLAGPEDYQVVTTESSREMF